MNSESSKDAQLALPAPGDEPVRQKPNVQTITLDGGSVVLDNLGPMVINTDGSLGRITNWHQMEQEERDKVLRVLCARNRKRMKELQEQGVEVEVDVKQNP